MASEIDELIEGLSSEDGLTRACQTAEAWAEAGRVGDLLTLATALEERGDPKHVAVLESVVDHVKDQAALAKGNEAADAVLALSLGDRTRTVRVPRPRAMRMRAFASRLAYAQEPSVLTSVLARAGGKPEHEEVLACWMHEVVLRGHAIASDPVARKFHEQLARRGHPLGTLPLELCTVEREAPSYLPLYGEQGLGRAIAALERGPISAKTVPPPSMGQAARVTRIDDSEIVDRLATAVRPWSDATNGKLEAKVFEVDPPIDIAGAWLLRALPIDAALDVKRLEVERGGPETVFGPLFSAAANGGAYSAGLGAAYGRRAAWTTLGALVGEAADASIAAIADAASASAHLSFRAPGPWFHDVAWDLGVLTVRRDGRTVAVLAATDKD